MTTKAIVAGAASDLKTLRFKRGTQKCHYLGWTSDSLAGLKAGRRLVFLGFRLCFEIWIVLFDRGGLRAQRILGHHDVFINDRSKFPRELSKLRLNF